MDIHLRADHTTPGHTTFTVFINGANCGQLIMRTGEAASLHQIVSMGCAKFVDKFTSTGEWESEDADREMIGDDVDYGLGDIGNK